MPSPIRSFRLALSLSALAFAVALTACGGSSNRVDPEDITQQTYAASLGIDLTQFKSSSDGIAYLDNVVGTGAFAVSGNVLTISYRGYLTDGTDFSANDTQRDAFTVDLSQTQLIYGFTEGLLGDGNHMAPMAVGGQRRVIVPPSAGYGPYDNGSIPGNSTLIFDIGLSSVQ